MRRLSRLALCTASLTLLLAPATAAAKDLNGRFGVGGQATTLGSQGLSFKYWIGHLGVNLITGGSTTSLKFNTKDADGKDVTAERTISTMDAELRVLFNAARARSANLYLGGGFAIGRWSDEPGISGVDEKSATELGFELLLGTEYFFSNHFAVSAEVGVPIRLPGEDGPAIGGRTPIAHAEQPVEGDTRVFTGEGSRIGFMAIQWAAGFHFYF